jgi:uncharacterized Zn finger protein
MSGASACACKPRNVVVVHRQCNYSAFNGYHRTSSAYSLVRCKACGTCWRTRAAYVNTSPDEVKAP